MSLIKPDIVHIYSFIHSLQGPDDATIKKYGSTESFGERMG